MVAAFLLALLLIPGSLLSQQTAAKSTSVQPCSDYEQGFPPCGIPETDQNKANKIFHQGEKLTRKKQFDLALAKLKEARAISPRERIYASAERAIQERLAAEELRKGNQAMLANDVNAAVAAFRLAAEIDPTNEYAQQRLHDALPAPEEIGAAQFRPKLGETRLEPKPEVHSFEFKGSSLQALEGFAKLFGITAVPDQGLTARNVRIKLDDVTWETGSQILQRVCKVLMIPLGEHQVLLANDTEENRRDLMPMTLRTYYSLGGNTPQELTELANALRTLFELRYITPDAAQGTIVIRAPQQTIDAITTFLEYLRDDQPTVMLEVKVFQISTTFTRDLGISAPTEFTVFNVATEINKLVTSGSFQQIVAALVASGQTVNATTILAALLASSSSTVSSVLTQPFATFGGGLTLSGVTIPTVSAHFSNNNSLARTLDDVLLRSEHGQAATMKVGERYPIVSATFSAASPATSLLSSLGITATATATSTPTPQFYYEDLGLVLKATPQVHGKLISLDYDLTVRALGATEPNGLPDVTNREMKGTISTEDGEAVVVAGLVDRSQMASINGIPMISEVPGLGEAFSVHAKQVTADELLVVIKPHITSERTHGGSYILFPTNIPK